MINELLHIIYLVAYLFKMYKYIIMKLDKSFFERLEIL